MKIRYQIYTRHYLFNIEYDDSGRKTYQAPDDNQNDGEIKIKSSAHAVKLDQNQIGKIGFKYGRNRTPIMQNQIRKGLQNAHLVQSMTDSNSQMSVQDNYKPKRLKNPKNLNYTQRKESIVSNMSTNKTSYMAQSKIPVPKAVKKIVK